MIIAWTGSTMTVLFGAMKATGILRVSSEVEDAGMDDSKHGGAHSDYKVEQLVKSGNLEGAAAASAANAKA